MSYVIPIGPYHPALEEPVHVKLYTDGEFVDDAKVYIGYNNRGIEKLAQEKNFIQTITLVERVCGICSHSHSLAYCLAIENIAELEVPKRGSYIRVIICELERLHSHFLLLGLAAHIIGFDSAFMYTFSAREKVMEALETLTGNRVNYAMNIIGGARRDIDKEGLKNLLMIIEELKEPYERIIDIFGRDKTVALRTKGVGKLTYDEAWIYGLSGPHGRASGLKCDTRKIDPYCSYEDFNFNMVVQKDGDVFSRVLVRLLEIGESIRIITQAAENMPDTPINLGVKIPRVPAGEYCTRIEAPRGELTYYVVTDGSQGNRRVNIHVPTFRNAASVPAMLKGNTVADAGLIVASIDPCFSCLDR
ncbi:Formate hydrogenlyase subunit 5 precursor [Clostridium liquoris]|jgi:Ni,Fe-hydrogenase III large subunit|uniref:Formate hydrogenlyase subunit 5 n=1 Tax=Clostridium liquoris TaxID=1289519 RepID=A0A2T0B4I5_9CLOT|nr:nickel-dependent hydrogenase large subunit [Clostridium liquoris]PRR78723.1 Formate hydrogenlyase subunit 5 precursor [Clostridium liquoris]